MQLDLHRINPNKNREKIGSETGFWSLLDEQMMGFSERETKSINILNNMILCMRILIVTPISLNGHINAFKRWRNR